MTHWTHTNFEPFNFDELMIWLPEPIAEQPVSPDLEEQFLFHQQELLQVAAPAYVHLTSPPRTTAIAKKPRCPHHAFIVRIDKDAKGRTHKCTVCHERFRDHIRGSQSWKKHAKSIRHTDARQNQPQN